MATSPHHTWVACKYIGPGMFSNERVVALNLANYDEESFFVHENLVNETHKKMKVFYWEQSGYAWIGFQNADGYRVIRRLRRLDPQSQEPF